MINLSNDGRDRADMITATVKDDDACKVSLISINKFDSRVHVTRVRSLSFAHAFIANASLSL